jgi:peptide/nickel transport system substrate-binding protein
MALEGHVSMDRKGAARAGALVLSLALALSACGKSATTAPPAAAATAPSATSAAPAGSDASAGAAGTASASPAASPAASALPVTTQAATTEVDSVTWAVYRDVQTIDPIYVFDYPDNAAVSLLCESLSRQQPDGTITDGLATLSKPDDKTLVYAINPAATFWDGTPVTADDAVFSLNRQRDPKLGGFYGVVFSRVASITATDAHTVTIKLSQPDSFLPGELASIAGLVVEKKQAAAAADKFGTPSAGVMCSGAFKNSGWTVGQGMTLTRNDAYWKTGVHPMTKAIKLVGVLDPTALTTGLLSGDLNGTYMTSATGTLDQLRNSGKVTVTEGPSYTVDAFVTSKGNGVLADPIVRKALSMAIDRSSYLQATYEGAAAMPKSFAPKATWGYAPDVFAAADAALPDLSQGIDAAKQLLGSKSLAGKKIVIGMIQTPAMAAEADAVKTAAEAIGLTVELKAIAPDAYINLFVDPKSREGIDGWFTLNYPDSADPASLLGSFATPTGPQNYSGYSNPTVTAELDAARSATDPTTRAQHVVAAQKIVMDELPWIPMAFPSNISVTSNTVTGQTASFTYMFAPWADTLGGK